MHGGIPPDFILEQGIMKWIDADIWNVPVFCSFTELVEKLNLPELDF